MLLANTEVIYIAFQILNLREISRYSKRMFGLKCQPQQPWYLEVLDKVNWI